MLASIWSLNIVLFHVLNGFGAYPIVAAGAIAVHENHILRFAVLTAPYAYYWFSPNRTLDLERTLLVGLASVLFAILIARGLANFLPFEVRPMYDPSSGFRTLAIKHDPDMESWSSFPSDTAAVCFALTLSLYPISRWASAALTFAALLLFCIPRIILGVHYPLDITVGVLIGGGSALLTEKLFSLSSNRFHEWTCRLPDKLYYPLMIIYLSEASQMFSGFRALRGILIFLSTTVGF